tara:strand:+ start:277 stop:549 length:273 start_codon:yes stop_codon:yes gene_type:complete
MRIFILKTIVFLGVLYIFFELAIGSRIDNVTKKIDMINDHEKRIELKDKIREEMKKGLKKDNLLKKEDRELIVNFLNKLKKELSDKENTN